MTPQQALLHVKKNREQISLGDAQWASVVRFGEMLEAGGSTVPPTAEAETNTPVFPSTPSS
eukprot:CAMPEP_0114560206 /NCGR_PEP_ID=MMETSP0114-20121206/11338_1 /TAXON_ID=31324 /ORGANISM="Goniomonas sp, Strain m" /LENGTH=60 /DNA_ID=CAMNT_0001745741 /DNA_START=147 /DNA_END=329 /DNA_ORIENTATION=-